MLRKLWAYLRVAGRANRNRTDLLRHLVRRPQLGIAVGTYETALLTSSRVDTRLKVLASIRASSRIGCPF